MADLCRTVGERVAEQLMPGAYIRRGGLSLRTPGFRTHSEVNHTHDSAESFLILRGRGHLEVNGVLSRTEADHVIVVEAGEEHYLIGDLQHPILDVLMHCADERHPNHTVGC